MALLFTFAHFLLEDFSGALALMGVCGVSLVGMFLLKWTGSIRISGNLVITGIYSVILFFIISYDGLLKIYGAFLLIMPIYSILVSGYRSALVWFAVVVATVNLFYFEWILIRPEDIMWLSSLSHEVAKIDQWLGLLGFLIMVPFAIFLIQRENDQLIEALRHANERLEYLSHVDELTGLKNRRSFNHDGKMLFSQARRNRQYFGLMIFDVDDFKACNDFYGHEYGDQVLSELGQALKETLKRGDDYLFRIGGEEFAVILYAQTPEQVMSSAEMVRSRIFALDLENIGNERTGKVTISMGVYVDVPEQEMQLETAYRLADEAMYRAKHEGKNTVRKA